MELRDFEFDEPRMTAVCRLASMQQLPAVLEVLQGLPEPPQAINVRSFGLQDVFLALTGRSLRE